MTNPVLSFFGLVSGGLIKWALVAALWLGSIVFVVTGAGALEAISNLLSGFKGIPTPYLDQKDTIKGQKDTIDRQKDTIKNQKGTVHKVQDELARKRADVKRHGTEVRGFASKMAARNVADASTSLIPIAGGVLAVTFSIADVYAACELVTMQNELERLLGIEGELSNAESVCATSVEQVDELGQEAEAKLAEMKRTGQEISEVVTEYWAEQICRVTGDC